MPAHFWLPFIGGLLAYAAIVSGGVWLISRYCRRHRAEMGEAIINYRKDNHA